MFGAGVARLFPHLEECSPTIRLPGPKRISLKKVAPLSAAISWSELGATVERARIELG
jgi:hypothetical protein